VGILVLILILFLKKILLVSLYLLERVEMPGTMDRWNEVGSGS
jgi:hypothetical protein